MKGKLDVAKVEAAFMRPIRPSPATREERVGRSLFKRGIPNVKSSMMTRVEYDHELSELDITFVGGRIYRYLNVAADIYHDLLDAPSQGSFFNERIKDGFEFREVVSRPR